jgi:hypothetical protein
MRFELEEVGTSEVRAPQRAVPTQAGGFELEEVLPEPTTAPIRKPILDRLNRFALDTGRREAIKSTARGLLYGEGLPEGLGLLQRPAEKAVDAIGKLAMTPEEEESLQIKYPNLMAMGYAAASIAPFGRAAFSPTERKEFERLPAELQRVSIISETAGWSITPAAFKALGFVGKKALEKTAPRFVEWMAKNANRPIGDIIKETTPVRMRTIKERGLARLSVDDLIKSEKGDIASAARKYPEVFEALKEQRVKGEAPVAEPVIRPEPPITPEELPIGERGFRMAGEHDRWFPEVAQDVLARRAVVDRGLPPGQGFEMRDVPAMERFSPEFAGRLKDITKREALPPAQGFELIEVPVTKRRPGWTAGKQQEPEVYIKARTKKGDIVARRPPTKEEIKVKMPAPKPKPKIETIAKDLKLTYNGPQEGVGGKIAGYLFTDPKTKSTFTVKTPKRSAIEAGLKQVRERYEKPKPVVKKALKVTEIDKLRQKQGLYPAEVISKETLKDLPALKRPESIQKQLDFLDKKILIVEKNLGSKSGKVVALKGLRNKIDKNELWIKNLKALEKRPELKIVEPSHKPKPVAKEVPKVKAKEPWEIEGTKVAKNIDEQLRVAIDKMTDIATRGAHPQKGIKLGDYEAIKDFANIVGEDIAQLKNIKEEFVISQGTVLEIQNYAFEKVIKKLGITKKDFKKRRDLDPSAKGWFDTEGSVTDKSKRIDRFINDWESLMKKTGLREKIKTEKKAAVELEKVKDEALEQEALRYFGEDIVDSIKIKEINAAGGDILKASSIKALKQGKPVPAKVLAEYPELKPKAAAPEKPSPFDEAPKLSIDRVEAKKRPDGKFQLFFRGTRNEVFPDESFRTAAEARNFFKVEKLKYAKKIISSERGAVTVKGRKKKKLSKYQADNIAWEPRRLDLSKEGIKNIAAKAYTVFKMREYPVVRLAKKAGMEATEIVENQIRRLRGTGGVVEEMLTGKGPFRIINYGTEKETVQYVKGAKSLKDILSPLKSRQEYIDYETLRVAERDVALAIHRPDIKGTDLKSSQAEIERLEAEYSPEEMTKLRKISKEHRTFERQAVLRPLVDIGWISKKSYDEILAKPESEYYASFAREMDVVESYTAGGKDPIKKIRGSERKKVPSTEATISNVYRTAKLVETIRLNREVIKLRELSPELEELIVEVKPQYITKDVLTRPGPRGGTKVSIRSPVPPKQTIVVPIDGVKHFWKVPPDVHKALDYYSPREMSTAIKVMSIPTKWLRAGATLSAEFIARNPIRDQLSAYVYSNYGYKPFWDFGKGVFNVLKKTDIYHEFKASGAEQAYFVSVDRQALNVNTRKVVGWKAATTKDVVDVMNPLSALQTISMWMEKGTRVGAFARARKKGATPTQAMAEARELTLDFARLGTERALNQIIAFWNANVEGTDKMVRSFKSFPYKTLWRAMLGITIPSITLWSLYHDDERIKALPDWRKNFCWNIPIPNGPIISIPKPFELGIIFGSLPERTLDYIAKDDPEAIQSITKAIKDGAAPGLIPTAALPIIENIANYSFFMDRPLEGEALQGLPKGMRARSYSSELSKRTGKITNLSPIKIDNWIRAWTGTLGKQTLDLLDPVLEEKAVPRPEKKWYEIAPGIKGFVAKEPIGGAGIDVERFYKNMQKSIEAANGYTILKTENPKEAVKFDKKTHGIKKYAKVARTTAKTLGQYSKKRSRILKSSLSPKVKRKKIEEINLQMTKFAKKFNDKFKAKK